MRKLNKLAPVLISIFTVTSLYAANAERLDVGQIWIPLVIAPLFAGLFMLLFWLHKWTAKSMPFIASVFTLVMLLWAMFPVWVSLTLLLAGLVTGIFARKYTEPATKAVSLIALIAIVVTVGQGAFIRLSNHEVQEHSTIAAVSNPGPDIYFIVPDRMPSPVAMREAGINPDAFINKMRGMGFYVKEDQLSHDPYAVDTPMDDIHTTRTMRFFASVLNDGRDIPLNIDYRTNTAFIKQPELFSKLHAKGYTIINVASWFAETNTIIDADYNLHYQDIPFSEKLFQNEFSQTFWKRTILAGGINLRFLQSTTFIGGIERGRAEWQANRLIEYSKSVHGQSIFAMAHILMPHEPFVFNAEGGPADTSLSEPEQYYAQIAYALDYLPSLAAQIRANDPTAIIIIQADEGMAYAKPKELNYSLTPEQWDGVLTAWYIPGAEESELQKLKHTKILKYVLER